MNALLLLLLACPLSAQKPIVQYLNLFGDDSDSTAWVVVRVDSLNLGNGRNAGPDCHIDEQDIGFTIVTCGPDVHDWVRSETRFRQRNQLPIVLLGPGERWTEAERERICRICLRHEWVTQKWVPRPKPKSEFEQLREQLSTIQLYEIHPIHPDSSSARADSLWPKP